MPQVRDVSVFLTGKENGRLAESPPFPVDRRVLEVGQERYRIFCTPCHGELGNGQGVIVRAGSRHPRTSPATGCAAEPLGHFFDVITNGHGVMYSYASRVPPEERWSIAAYIRALQLSQHAVASELPVERPEQDQGNRTMSLPSDQAMPGWHSGCGSIGSRWSRSGSGLSAWPSAWQGL